MKDLVDTANQTTAGSAHYADRVPIEDAAHAPAEKCGAILLGKLNMDEFAYNYTAETSFFGPTPTLGSAADAWRQFQRVGRCGRCRHVFCGTGIGHRRIHTLAAALCGITGLKPTYGREHTRRHSTRPSLDHIGPMCRSVRDAAWVLDTIAEQN
ncbi:MAG: amidase family protein [Bryobacteraceae bacterium]